LYKKDDDSSCFVLLELLEIKIPIIFTSDCVIAPRSRTLLRKWWFAKKERNIRERHP